MPLAGTELRPQAQVRMPRTGETSVLQGVSNALSVLDALARHGPDLGVAEVGRLLDLPRSTAFRLLSTLEHQGFVEQHPESKKYRLGLRLFELAGIVWSRLELGQIALPLLDGLARATEETVHLVVLDREESLIIEKVDSPRAVYLRSHVGSRRPLHCTATGKVLLAFLPPAELEAVIRRGLPRFTESTVTDPDRLREELAEVRRRGYALNWGEYRDEAAGVAAPVRDRGGRVVAAVGTAIPIGRLPGQRVEVLSAQVVECARQISGRLGWSAAGTQVGAAAPAP